MSAFFILFIRSVFHALSFLVFQVVFSSCLAAQIQPPRIGFILPLSGEWAFLGSGIRDAAVLAIEDLKAQGQSVELIFEDNQGSLIRSATLGKQLISNRKIDAVVSIISGVGKILQPLANTSKIISVAICSETEIADGKYSFINYLTAEQGVSRFYLQFGSNKSLGVFSLNESGFHRIVEELQRKVPANVSIKFIDFYEKGTSDFYSLLTKRRRSGADAWLLLGITPEIEVLAVQSHSLGITTPLTSIEGFGLAKNKAPFEGAWYIDSAFPGSSFTERFSKRYGYEITPGAAQSYDSVILLASVFKDSLGLDGKVIGDAAARNFQSIKGYPGVVGKLSVQENGVIWSEASVRTIKNGKSVLLSEIK